MPTFSNRYGYNSQIPQEPILEDAPAWLRISFIDRILDRFTYIDNDSRYANTNDSPLGIKALNEVIYVRLRKELNSAIYDSWYCTSLLHDLVKDSEWYEFYDIVEIVGKEVLLAEEKWRGSLYHIADPDYEKRAGF
jgi:hypothetical protein